VCNYWSSTDNPKNYSNPENILLLPLAKKKPVEKFSINNKFFYVGRKAFDEDPGHF